MQDLKLSDDLVSNCRFDFEMNELNKKENCYISSVLCCEYLVQDQQTKSSFSCIHIINVSVLTGSHLSGHDYS